MNKYQKMEFSDFSGPMSSRILLPKVIDTCQELLLKAVLCGAGECGNSNEAHLTHGRNLYLQNEVRKNSEAKF